MAFVHRRPLVGHEPGKDIRLSTGSRHRCDYTREHAGGGRLGNYSEIWARQGEVWPPSAACSGSGIDSILAKGRSA